MWGWVGGGGGGGISSNYWGLAGAMLVPHSPCDPLDVPIRSIKSVRINLIPSQQINQISMNQFDPISADQSNQFSLNQFDPITADQSNQTESISSHLSRSVKLV